MWRLQGRVDLCGFYKEFCAIHIGTQYSPSVELSCRKYSLSAYVASKVFFIQTYSVVSSVVMCGKYLSDIASD